MVLAIAIVLISIFAVTITLSACRISAIADNAKGRSPN